MRAGIDAVGGERRRGFAERRRPTASAAAKCVAAVGGRTRTSTSASRARDEHVLGAPIVGRRGSPAPLMRGPDRRGGVGETQQPRGGMKDEAQFSEPLRIDRGQFREAQRPRLGGVIGLDPRVLQPRDVRQIGEFARRLEAATKSGKSAP